jgi:hypothetical protein
MFPIEAIKQDSLVIFILTLLFVCFLLYPVSDFINIKFTQKITEYLLLLITAFLMLGYTIYAGGVNQIINLIFVVVLLWSFWYGISIDRKYIYYLALFFLLSAPLLFIFKAESVSRSAANLGFILLAFGVLKDMFYEKIFEN